MEIDSDRGAKDVFLELEALSPEEQEARLASIDDDAVVATVRGLLDASNRADAFFSQLPILRPRDDDRSGERIGPYAVESLLGEGGMGSVWLAERVDGEFRQTVAIKVLRSHVSGEGAEARFKSEREILAGLVHPAIASLFDGGVTGDGRPYFVMEYVDGVPIDEYCKWRGLDIDAKLELLAQVCDALEHAHERGVVHRDVKPANVLVTKAGDVKLLDFGIAKLIRETATAHSFETETGITPMTPAYASPEQVAGEQVSPATDTYSLGVLLYLLLTEVLPYDVEGESRIKWARAICDAPVMPPSRRIALRRETTSGLHRRLRGDLDTIVMMALRKEPERRYPNAGALAEDIRRHLNRFPVLARADSRAYRTSRFVARHKHAVAIGVVALVATFLSLGATFKLARSNTVKAHEIETERAGRTELLDHLVGLYESADPWSPGANAGTRMLLGAAVERLEVEDDGDPETRATLLRAAGRVYLRLANYGRARELLEEALELRRGEVDAPDAELAQTIFDLGRAYGASGDVQRGISLIEEALQMEIELHGPNHLNVGRARYELAKGRHDRGTSAGGDLQEALRIFRSLDGELTEEYVRALLSRVEVVAVSGRPAEAVDLSVEALDVCRELYGVEHPAYAKAAEGLGMIYCSIGRKAEGIDLLREALVINRATYSGINHPSLAWNLLNLGGHLAWNGDDSGVQLTEEAVEMYRNLPTKDHSTLGFALTSFGRILAQRDGERAIDVFEEALDVYSKGRVHPGHARSAKLELAELYEARGDVERAIALLEQVADAEADRRGESHERVRVLRRRVATLRESL